jgi:hypothetical protein
MNTRLPITALALIISAPALAQQVDSPLSPLFECRQIPDDAQRLACLDSAVDTLYQSENSGEVVAVNRSELEAAEEATYGLNIPEFRLPRIPSVSLPSLSGGASSDLADAADASAEAAQEDNTSRRVVRNDDGDITGIEGLAVQNIERGPYDRMIITLQNGQVWRQIDDTRVLYSRRQPFTEMSVAVRSATLGSHMMQLNDRGRWFRVRREQ